MDKDCVIIFLILILIIALLNRRNDNKYTKDFQKYYKGIKKDLEKKFKRESFYNLIPNNRYQISEEHSINNTNFNNQQNSDHLYSENENIRNIPYKVAAISYSGDNKIYVNSINGIQIGDQIKINPKGDNYEEKTVTGIGNHVLGLDSDLEKEHVPNEPILNISNSDLNYGKVKEKGIKISRYAYINNQGKINYSPEQETWNVPEENNISSSEEINGIEKDNLYFI